MWVTVALAVVLATVTLVWVVLTMRMFSLRHHFEIAARCPSLGLLALITALCLPGSVLLHWLLRSVGRGLPCYVIYAVSNAGELVG